MNLSASLKRLVLPGEDWSLDVDLRYLPVARFLQTLGTRARVLEIGSGSTGITPYLDREVVGCDIVFPVAVSPRLLPVVARGQLPFHDGSFDAVVSLDTLEHVPREHRQMLMDEMFRITRRHIVIGFPEGEAAERHDARMEAYFVRQNTDVHEYFVEHRQYRIPRPEDMILYLRKAGEKLGCAYTVRKAKNVNIRLRSIFMRTVWSRNQSLQKLYTMLTGLSRWDRLFHHGVCYRSIYFISKDHAIP